MYVSAVTYSGLRAIAPAASGRQPMHLAADQDAGSSTEPLHQQPVPQQRRARKKGNKK